MNQTKGPIAQVQQRGINDIVRQQAFDLVTMLNRWHEVEGRQVVTAMTRTGVSVKLVDSDGKVVRRGFGRSWADAAAQCFQSFY